MNTRAACFITFFCFELICRSLADPVCQSTEILPSGGKVFHDTEYLPEYRSERMDVYLPPAPAMPIPCFLYIHGGGWKKGDKRTHPETLVENVFRPLLDAGIAVASINYNMADKPRWPRNLYDCKQAVCFLKQNAGFYGINPEGIVVGGGSAGGHLALMTAMTSGNPRFDDPNVVGQTDSRVVGGVDFFGITDVRLPMVSKTLRRYWGNILFDGSSNSVPERGDNPEFPAVWEDASPVCHVSKDTVPLLLIHGEKDKTVEIGQAETLYEKLKVADASVDFIPVPDEGHGIGVRFYRPDLIERVIRFIRNIAGDS